MKHITFIQVNYDGLARGTTIMVLRGDVLREYHYSSKRTSRLFNAAPRKQWQDKFYHDRITLQRVF